MKQQIAVDSKSIARPLWMMILSFALIPVIIMTISAYLLVSNLVNQRLQLDQKSAVTVLIDAKDNLRHQTTTELTNLASLPLFHNDKFDVSKINTALQQAKLVGDAGIVQIGFATPDGKMLATEK